MGKTEAQSGEVTSPRGWNWNSYPGLLDFSAHDLIPVPDPQAYAGPRGHKWTKMTDTAPALRKFSLAEELEPGIDITAWFMEARGVLKPRGVSPT